MMRNEYMNFFGFTKEPFRSDISTKEILVTPSVKGISERIQYAIHLGAIALVTGEIGNGKSTALRYAVRNLSVSKYRIINVVASSGSIIELYQLILSELGIHVGSNSRAVMSRQIKKEILETVHEKVKTLLIIDEASILRPDVFSELHTLTQFGNDSKPFLPIVLAGQSNLVDNLKHRSSLPLTSRIVGKSHLKAINLKSMKQYLIHHLSIAGVNQDIFEDAAVTAIHQGACGLLRKGNNLARGAIIAAHKSQSATVTTEHVRIAATEIF